MQALILVVSALISLITTPVAPTRQNRASNDTAQQSRRLEVQLFTEKHVYKRGDKLNLKVMVINTSDQDTFVYGDLEWGYLASLTLSVRDPRGRNVRPKFFSDVLRIHLMTRVSS